MSAWRPIETAPNDGTTILLYGYWAGEIHGPSNEAQFLGAGSYRAGRTDFPGFDWDLDGGDAYATWGKPTHWMPLPDPPGDNK